MWHSLEGAEGGVKVSRNFFLLYFAVFEGILKMCGSSSNTTLSLYSVRDSKVNEKWFFVVIMLCDYIMSRISWMALCFEGRVINDIGGARQYLDLMVWRCPLMHCPTILKLAWRHFWMDNVCNFFNVKKFLWIHVLLFLLLRTLIRTRTRVVGLADSIVPAAKTSSNTFSLTEQTPEKEGESWRHQLMVNINLKPGGSPMK